MRTARLLAVAASLVAVSAPPAGAQVPPPWFLANPHPAMPWAFFTPNVGAFDYGTVVQYIPVPAQQVVIEVPVAVPDGVPPQTQKQIVEIPGYYITETTTGFWYPERWTLYQANAGVYQWMKYPPEFRRKTIVEKRPPARIP